MADRRQQPATRIPLIAISISAVSLFLGPCFGAVTATIGVYVANQTRSAVADEKLVRIQTSVDKLVAQNEERLRADGRTEQKLSDLERQVDTAQRTAERAEARAGNSERNSAVAASKK